VTVVSSLEEKARGDKLIKDVDGDFEKNEFSITKLGVKAFA
jgi:hypothetical protein